MGLSDYQLASKLIRRVSRACGVNTILKYSDLVVTLHNHNLLQFGSKREGASPPSVGGRTQTLRAAWRYGTYRDQI
jgi:hypothetical protein